MMAQSGAEVIGVDVAPLLERIYDGRYPTQSGGSVALAHGKFPKDEKVAERVGRDFDLVISKNTLKRGYIHPAREARPGTTIDLGVEDATFLKTLYDRMKPGALFVIYNLCPAKSPLDKPYIPWADGESPFSKEQFEAAGFEVLAFDVEDNAAARALGKALGWDKQMKLESELFSWYTIVRRK
jgi:hypothetical protein